MNVERMNVVPTKEPEMLQTDKFCKHTMQ